MTLKDNALKAYLKNVYFLTGTPCAGKTTLSRALGARHGLLVYDADERFAAHQQLTNPLDQPAMHRVFEDADQFFGRTPQEYAQWLEDNTRQQLDFVLLDLIRLSADRPVLCDCRLTVQEAGCLSEPSRVAFLLRAPARLADDYCSRPDHQDFYRFLLSASNPEAAQSTLRKRSSSAISHTAVRSNPAAISGWSEPTSALSRKPPRSSRSTSAGHADSDHNHPLPPGQHTTSTALLQSGRGLPFFGRQRRPSRRAFSVFVSFR